MFGKAQEKPGGGSDDVLLQLKSESQEKLFQVQLLRVASELTQMCLVHGKTKEEAMSTFCDLYEDLLDWFGGAPLKEQVATMMEMVFPAHHIDNWKA